MPYATPAAGIVPVVDAPPPPLVSLGPGGRFAALVHRRAHPPVSLLARPYLALAGLRIDPRLRARRRVRQGTGVSVLRVADGRERYLPLPAEAVMGSLTWAPDGQRIAFTVDGEDGVSVWVADAGTGEVRAIPGLTVCDVLGGDPGGGGTLRWSRDGRSLLVLAVPAHRPAPPPPVIEPRIGETAGQRSQVATFADLLATPSDAAGFEALAASVPCRVSAEGGTAVEFGPPALYHSLDESPDGRFVLVQRLQRPFSFRVPWFWFARRTEVWHAGGELAAVIADLPPSEEVPRQGVPAGPRLASWLERAPATVAWVEALDGGDPVAPAEHRDRLLTLSAPFATRPARVADLRQRCLGWYDLDERGRLLVVEHDRDRRWLTTWLCELAAPDADRVIFGRSADDAYAHPGTPLVAANPDGTQTVLSDGSAIYLRGDGATPEGRRPFLDRFDLATRSATRLHASPPGGADYVLGFTGGRAEVVVWHESPAEPPNLAAVTLGGGRSRPLTAWPHPHPPQTAITQRLAVHDRGDGVTLSGMLYLPPGYDPARDGPLPLVMWAYPYDYGSASTASQIRADTFEFTRLTPLGPAVLAAGGYAVLADATMPVIGDPETMNDTYVEQITAAARAHVRALAAAGVADPARVAVGGHSYGGFMTANLLAHTGDFTAGIARSGAYNRSLTPFGFQTERRSFWEATAVYDRVSPFRYADRITAPLLLIHGDRDDNSGTYPLQSERLFQAIQANGGTARLVMLPHESHVYLARESVLHVLAEQFDWLARWLGKPGAPQRAEPAFLPAARVEEAADQTETRRAGPAAGQLP